MQKSQTYSDYKSTNTLKSLTGVDNLGGIMFVSHLYTGGILDKVLWSVKPKTKSDIMADKGFTIANELKEIGLCLNIPPLLGKRKRLTAAYVQNTQVIANHRIHVERPSEKLQTFISS